MKERKFMILLKAGEDESSRDIWRLTDGSPRIFNKAQIRQGDLFYTWSDSWEAKILEIHDSPMDIK